MTATTEWTEFPGGLSALGVEPLAEHYPAQRWLGRLKREVLQKVLPDVNPIEVGVDGIQLVVLGEKVSYRFTEIGIHRLGEKASKG